MSRSLDEYAAARQKVDATLRDLHTRCGGSLTCHSGCAGCCEVDLDVAAVEAEAIRQALAALPPSQREEVRTRSSVPSRRCVMLDDADRCVVYESRPFVCRTQGLPLRYPHDVVPVASVRSRVQGGDLVVCPLNFTDGEPTLDQALDAERVDLLLGLIDHRFGGGATGPRVALRDLALGR